MTITNHIRDIETFAQLTLVHVDAKEYGKAHCDLDVLEKKVRAVREHVDHLQDVTPRAFSPAGGS